MSFIAYLKIQSHRNIYDGAPFNKNKQPTLLNHCQKSPNHIVLGNVNSPLTYY